MISTTRNEMTMMYQVDHDLKNGTLCLLSFIVVKRQSSIVNRESLVTLCCHPDAGGI
jgi:hypothetical protein